MKRLLSVVLLVAFSFSAIAQIATSKLINRSGDTVNQYAVVVVDSSNASSFTTTTTAGDGQVLGIDRRRKGEDEQRQGPANRLHPPH